MKTLGNLILHQLKKHKLTPLAQSAFVLEKSIQVIENHWGESARKSIVPWKYRNGKIYLKSTSGSWRQEITKHKKSLLLLLQHEIPNAEITGIIIL